MAAREIEYRTDEMHKNARKLRDHTEVATKHVGKVLGRTLPGDDEVLAELKSAFSMLCETVGATVQGTQSWAEFAAQGVADTAKDAQAVEEHHKAVSESLIKELADSAATAAPPVRTLPDGVTPAPTSADTGYHAPPA